MANFNNKYKKWHVQNNEPLNETKVETSSEKSSSKKINNECQFNNYADD